MKKPVIAVVSSSLRAQSRSRAMSRGAAEILREAGAETSFINLAELNVLPYPRSNDDAAVRDACARFNAADGWVIATPVYNFGASGGLLDFLHIALDSDLGKWKPFVLLSSLGGVRSSLSLDHLARTLVYEVSAVQVGPALLCFNDTEVNPVTGALSAELAGRMRTQLGVLVKYGGVAQN
jgi:NAD(P)H-dependent FMN reductase